VIRIVAVWEAKSAKRIGLRKETNMAKRNIMVIGAAAIVALYLPVLFLPMDTLAALTHEDAFYESTTALFFFMASIVFLYAFARSTPRNIFFLLFALVFVFAAGEEISWGQRIFHFATPAAMVAGNAQGEFNIHNLNFIQHETGLGSSLKGMLLNFNRLFIMASVLYCILIPLAHKYSAKLRDLFLRLRLPILTLWFGVLFVVNEVTSKTLEVFVINARCQSGCPAIAEIKEALWGLFVLLWAIYFILVYVRAERPAPGVRLSVGGAVG
jgi:hypothetical protein